MARRIKIALVPEMDLHRGIHGELLQSPPAGFSYFSPPVKHVFSVRQEPRPFDCARTPHFGEFLDVPVRSRIVHSSRWPVLGHGRWITDLDDFGYPALVGRPAVSAVHRMKFRKPWSPGFADKVLCRAKVMLRAYAHPSCVVILTPTQRCIENAKRWFERLDLGEDGNSVLKKCRVWRPTKGADPYAATLGKWRSEKMKVIFCGMDFMAKRGGVALSVFQAIAIRFPTVEFTYVGNIPRQFQSKLRPLQNRMTWHPSISRLALQKVFARSHILLHPAPRESYGMALVEAAASGLAIIAIDSETVPLLREVFIDSGWIGVPPDPEAELQVKSCFHALANLIENPALARRHGLANHRLASEGALSTQVRDAALRDAYHSALEKKQANGISLTELLVDADMSSIRMPSYRVGESQIDCLRAQGTTRRSFSL